MLREPRSVQPVLLMLVALGLSGSAVATEEWPQYHGVGSDRVSAEVITERQWPSEGPSVVWREPTELGFSSFAIADGKAFTLVRRSVKDQDREVCLALDAGSGQTLWATPLHEATYDGGGDAGTDDNKGGDGPRSTPSVHDGRVYTFDASFGLTCLDAADGKVLWSHDLVKEYDAGKLRWQNAASPLLEGGRVFVAGGGQGRSLLAFDAVTGKLQWSAESEQPTHATPIATTLHGTRQVIFFVQSGLVAVTPEKGDVLWRAEYPYKVSTAASPVVSGDMVYVSAGYGVGAGTFRIHKDGQRWKADLLWQQRNKLMNHWSTPVCKDGFLYGMFSFKKYGEGPLMCVEMATGETRWSKDGYGPGNCILVGGDLLALSDAGELVLVEAVPDEYRELARAQVLEGKCWSSPAFSGGRAYVRSTVEGVCLDLGTASGTR